MSSLIPIGCDVELSPDEVMHRVLANSHTHRLSPKLDTFDFERELERAASITRLEHGFVEAERAAVAALVREVPADHESFRSWFESLKQNGPGQNDSLFPWLAHDATHRQMCWFLTQEMAGEAGFEDLVALSQVKLPVRPKLEMARNYWDEMGQGNESGMHGPMLTALGHSLDLKPSEAETVWEALALSNLMVALATARYYAYQSIGALGAIELTAPGRSEQVNAGLKRLGIGGAARRYYALHATLDVRHSEAWNREVLVPLVQENPQIASRLAEGALLRLRAGERCFARYRRELWENGVAS